MATGRLRRIEAPAKLKNMAHAIGVTVVLAFFPAALSAQWPSYQIPGVPRTPNGELNPGAPAPRTADGKPDLSGIWETPRRPAGQQGEPAEQPETPTGALPTATFQNIGVGFKGGLPLRSWAADLLKQRMAENSKDNPDAHCLPLGLMQLHMHPQPRKIIQNPGLIVILYEAQGGVRQIFTDGRPLPGNEVQPWWYGYSIGKWDGDTLVVETSGFRDDVWLDINGSPLTGAGKLTERFRRVDYGNLEIEITVDDQKVYTKPFTVKVNQRLLPDTELIEFICNENEKDAPHLVGK
jgi:hypothetical protein